VEIKADDYQIWYDPDSSTVFFRGFLRLDGIEGYTPVMNLLMNALEQSSQICLNLEALEFLNSSGISTLSIFVVRVRERKNVQLLLRGSNQVLWQTRSMKNLQRLMPSLQLELV